MSKKRPAEQTLDETATDSKPTTVSLTPPPIALSKPSNSDDSGNAAAARIKRPRAESVIDSMLAEAHDLIGAAAEAQALGRLKMSSSYLLLVHARLITLGKRFDRSLLPFPGRRFRTKVADAGDEKKSAGSTSEDSADPASTEKEDSKVQKKELAATSQQPENKGDSEGEEAKEGAVSSGQDEKTVAVAKTLANFMPKGIEFDATMMEHLARAAIELHKKRQGENVSVSPSSAADNASAQTGKAAPRIAWTDDEHQRCIDAVDTFGRDETKEIAKAVGTRTEKEVIAHLRNASEKAKATETLHHELQAEMSDPSLNR